MKRSNQQAGFIHRENSNSAQYGGTILGFIVGLGVGLGIAFFIAFYMSKNTPQERPGVRAPNLPLTIKSAPATAEGDAPAPAEPMDLNKGLKGKSMPAPSADPIADLVNGKKVSEAAPTPKTESIYFLQVGAYTQRADADSQKANLAIQGISSQLSEVTNDGNTVWRVRVGPFPTVEESNPVRDKLSGMGIKSTVIKSNKS
jgi:cell division protein FtsN